jgi:hypothetical protein
MGDSPSPTPGDFQGDNGITDSQGEVLLRPARNAPSEIFIRHPDFPAWRGLIEPWEDVNQELFWRISDREQDSAGDSAISAEVVINRPE